MTTRGQRKDGKPPLGVSVFPPGLRGCRQTSPLVIAKERGTPAATTDITGCKCRCSKCEDGFDLWIITKAAALRPHGPAIRRFMAARFAAIAGRERARPSEVRERIARDGAAQEAVNGRLLAA